MTDDEIIAGLLRIIDGLADQQAMNDDRWRDDPAYLAATADDRILDG